ncbi:carbohydrate-binding family 9-like protein [Mucilaginibacter auburnensis]|uniref:Carbohydrate binding protein with CBM9 domain n=1 Tax=Mucilaginibacter auburnensis TaxID=1457233 RepID=A0A2H9VS37_9SPHI|nr:carbohydrate-binding family 9-like protein [Mucilaginibacter auburnensis]PJJ83633.1 carbohydrate binding protein with CBM9 domain [Mucilaginibacter auburnensis]
MIRKIIASAACCLVACLSVKAQTPEKKYVIGELPSYKVAKATEPITVDGKMDEAAWKNAEVRSLDYFYRADKPVDKQATKFRMMWDETNLYLFYECQDTSLTARETAFDARPYLDDCAEFFVVPVPDSLNMHFGFEINITKAAYDYMMFWQYYQKRNYFVKGYNPAYKVEVTTNGTINNDKDKDKGWTMEIAIPIDALSNFGRPRVGAKWAFQAVRQDRNLVDDRFRSTSTLYPIYDIRLDVHQPNRFGIMEFLDKK